MNIDYRMEYALGSDNLPITLSNASDLFTHVTPQRNFINFRKAHYASFNDDIELKLNKQQKPTIVYHAKKILRKAINAAAGRHIPQRRIKTVVAIFPIEAVKLSEKEIQRKSPEDPKITQLNHEINKLVQRQKRKKWIEFVQTLTHRGNCSKLWSTVKGILSSNA